MSNPENVNSSETVDSQQESQKHLANQKFDHIFNKIYGNKPLDMIDSNGLVIQKDGDTKGRLSVFNNPNIGLQKITISWYGENGNVSSNYTLQRENGKFKLEITVGEEGIKEKVINNITPEELLNKFLPKIEKRLNEGEELKKQQRQKAIEYANQYAYQQDQLDADRLLQENGLA